MKVLASPSQSNRQLLKLPETVPNCCISSTSQQESSTSLQCSLKSFEKSTFLIFFADFPEIFILPVFLSTSCFFFNIWISTFFLYHITLFHEWETILIFYVSYTKNTLKKLSNKFAWQISAKFFNSPQMNPKLLKFPSWNQPSKLIEQTYLQPVNTTRLSNSPPE